MISTQAKRLLPTFFETLFLGLERIRAYLKPLRRVNEFQEFISFHFHFRRPFLFCLHWGGGGWELAGRRMLSILTKRCRDCR